MNLPWFRFYAEFSGDPVIQSLAFEDQRHYVMILCLKCNGTLDRDLPNQRRDLIILRGLGLDVSAGAEAKRRLLEVGLIDKSWQPTGWDKRQFRSDSSTERTRKYRKENEPGNVPETSLERHGDAPEQNRTDTEQNRGEIVIALPTNTGEEFPIHETQCAEWGALFPAVNVPQELRNMRAWLIGNQTKRKTRSGMLRFVTSWLTKQQNEPRKPSSGKGRMTFADYHDGGS